MVADGTSDKRVGCYTCLMSVYKNDSPDYLKVAIDSILNQTIVPDELLIVKDGPLTASLDEVLESYGHLDHVHLRFICFQENTGLWNALKVGVKSAANELILRMDADDYSEPSRAERQLSYMRDNPHCDCCGSTVVEFEGELDNLVSFVALPEEHDEIVSFSKYRDPIRHPSLLFKKSKVLSAGNYREMPYFEDYDLVLRMIDDGSVFYNIQEPLVRVRTDKDFFQRRGDRSYLKHMIAFRKAALKRGDISWLQYAAATAPHAVVCLMPNSMRKFVYAKLLRRPAKEGM